MLSRDGEVVVVCRSDVELPGEVRKWPHEYDQGNVREVVGRLAEEGVNEVLVEAGPRLTGSFLDSEQWDELIAYTAPKLLGVEGKPMAQVSVEHLSDAIGGTIASVDQMGKDVRIVIANTS